MRNVPPACHAARRLLQVLFGLLLALLLASPVFGQQEYVGRIDAYAGFGYLDSPHIGLAENGFHTQVGARATRWLSIGFDYMRVTGDLTIKTDLLPDALAAQIATQIAQLQALGRLPAGYALVVPSNSTTHTFAAGPQIAYRHFKWITLFVRPDLGAIHEIALPHPSITDAFAKGIVQSLAPSGKKTDTVIFYGFGGGLDINATKHFGLRVQADFVHDHLFKDVLKDSRNTVRFSIGPEVQFGGNVK